MKGNDSSFLDIFIYSEENGPKVRNPLLLSCIIIIRNFTFFMVLVSEPRALYTLGKHCSQSHPLPSKSLFKNNKTFSFISVS